MDWQTAEEMVRILSVVRAKSCLLESYTHITASLVLPCLMDLLYNDLPELPKTQTGCEFAAAIKSKVLSFVGDPLQFWNWALAC